MQVGKSGSSTPFPPDFAMLRSELESERKLKLATNAQNYERACEWVSELQDKNEQLKMKQAELNDKDQHIY